MIEIFLNGLAHQVPELTTIEGLIEQIGLQKKGVAIAVNSEVIPKSNWTEKSLLSQDKVELLTIAQGV